MVLYLFKVYLKYYPCIFYSSMLYAMSTHLATFRALEQIKQKLLTIQ